MTKMIQTTFLPPPMSWRRKRSAKTVIRSQNQITHAKITNNVQTTSRNGYSAANNLVLLSRAFSAVNGTGGVWPFLPRDAWSSAVRRRS